MSRTNTLGRYTQSIRPKDICILLVNDDYICRDIVSDMLDHCRYEVFSYEREMDSLNIIREKNDEIDLIMTNAHRTYAKYGIIEHIEKNFKLQIILMSPDVDDIKNSLIGGGNGVTVYFMKSLSVNEMNNLWASALAREKSKRELSSGKSLHVENAEHKRSRENDEQNGNVEKKPRVVWTKEMHQKFLEAVAQLGHDKAFPKKIVELMNVPGLTRENVASHLQKYRMCMKRAQEGFTGCSSYDFTDSYGFNTEETFQQSYHNPFQMGSLNTFTPHFSLNNFKLRSRIPPYTSLLNTIRIKPDHNFRVYGDQKKNVLLSIENSNVQPNSSFAGFRLARDGKSLMFGENSHLSSQQQPISFSEMGNDNSSLQSLLTPPGTVGEPVMFSSQLSSLAAHLGVDEPMQQSAPPPPPGFDWNKAASFTESPSAIMTPPQSAGLQWTDWSEPLSGNEANANSDIFSDFTSTSFLSEFCETGTVGDESGVDATVVSVFDDLLFDNQELTLDK